MKIEDEFNRWLNSS